MVMVDRERDERKAIPWILREITKTNPDIAVEFLVE